MKRLVKYLLISIVGSTLVFFVMKPVLENQLSKMGDIVVKGTTPLTEEE